MKVFGNLWKILKDKKNLNYLSRKALVGAYMHMMIYVDGSLCWHSWQFKEYLWICNWFQPINQSMNCWPLSSPFWGGVGVIEGQLEGRPRGEWRALKPNIIRIPHCRSLVNMTWSNFRLFGLLKFLFQIGIAGKRGQRGGRWSSWTRTRRGSRWSSSTSSTKIGGWGKRGERGMITPSLVNSQRSGRRGN